MYLTRFSKPGKVEKPLSLLGKVPSKSLKDREYLGCFELFHACVLFLSGAYPIFLPGYSRPANAFFANQ